MKTIEWKDGKQTCGDAKARGKFCARCKRRMEGEPQEPATTSLAKVAGTYLFVDETESGKFSYTVAAPAFVLDAQHSEWQDTCDDAKAECERMARHMEAIE